MHEASIAISTIEAIKDIEKKESIRAERVVIEVGQGSGVNIQALSFCLKQISDSENLNIVFEIIDTPITGYCGECKENFTLDYLSSICPKCHNLSFEIISGTELNIKEIEGDKFEG